VEWIAEVIRSQLIRLLKFCTAPWWGGFTFCATVPVPGRSLCFYQKESKAMTQAELNRHIAQQTGESITEIMRHGFTIMAALPDDAYEEWLQQLQRQQPTKPVAA